MLAVVAVGGITSALAAALPDFIGGPGSTEHSDSEGWAGYFATQQPSQVGRRNPTPEIRAERPATENLTSSNATDKEALGTVAASAWQDNGLPSPNEWINLPKDARFPGAIVVLGDSALADASSTLQVIGGTSGYDDTTAGYAGGAAGDPAGTVGNSGNGNAGSTGAGSGSGGSPTLAASGSLRSASRSPSGSPSSIALGSATSESASGSANDNPAAAASVAENARGDGESSTEDSNPTSPSSNNDTDSASSDSPNNDSGANGSGSGSGTGSGDDGPSATPGQTITGNDTGPTGPLIVDGELGGTTPIDDDVVVLADGTLSPGHSPGELPLNGSLELNGSLLIELEGENVGDFDRLFVAGDVSANAALVEFAFEAGFVPEAGDVFSFLFANGGLDDLFLNGELDPQQIDFFSTGLSSELIADVVLVEGAFTTGPIGQSVPGQFSQRLDLVILEARGGQSLSLTLNRAEVSEPVPFGLFAIGGLMLAFSRRITRR
jgi:hypothetical protein